MNTQSPVPAGPAIAVSGFAVALNQGWQRASTLVLSDDPRRRIRLVLWLICVMVYIPSAGILWLGIRQGWMHWNPLIAWCAFLATGLTFFYIALRTGWSERFADPALTSAQIMMGVIGVEWGYWICGPVRGVALYPLLLIFVFGAFSLSLRQIMKLTLLALGTLIATVVALNIVRLPGGPWTLENTDLRMDLTNVLMVMIILPALSVVAARLSNLRSKLHAQRSALTAALAEVQRLATHDELTGLANRRHIQERLLQEQSRHKRLGRPFSVAIIDLDHFKWVNDSQGHAGGDKVLRDFAAEVVATLRTSDLVARWGGEEFLILLPETTGSDALASIQRLLARVRLMPVAADGLLTFSAGVTEHRLDDTVAETIAHADREMYEAKNSGRNSVHLG